MCRQLWRCPVQGHLLPSDHASLTWRRTESLGQESRVMTGHPVLLMGLQRRRQRCQGSHDNEWAAGLARGGLSPCFSGFSSEDFLSLTGNCSLLGLRSSSSPGILMALCSLPASFFLLRLGSLHMSTLHSFTLHTFRGVLSECCSSQELLDQALEEQLRRTESKTAGVGEGRC